MYIYIASVDSATGPAVPVRVWHDDGMSDTDPVLRQPTTREDRLAALRELTTAFSWTANEAEIENDLAALEWDRATAVYAGEDGPPIGFGAAYSFGLTVPGGGTAPVSGITAVGVDPGERRRGILRRILGWLLDDARKRGEPIAVLWASEGAIYQRFGFGMATVQGSITLERARGAFLRSVDPVGRVRLIGFEEAMAVVPPLYDTARSVTTGALSRDESYWRYGALLDAEWSQRGAGPKYRALLESADGKPLGYALYRLKGEWDDRGPKYELTVLEVVASDPEAERTLWRWLLDMDLVATVKGWRQSVPHPLQLQLVEPRRLQLDVGDGLWLRVLDVAAALEARRYAGAGSIALEIRGGVDAAVAGRWSVATSAEEGSGGTTFRARVERTDAAPDLVLDLADLGAAYLGAFRFRDLVRAARVEEAVRGAAARADALFAVDRAPTCITGF
jgi:predicted acetyltransferase